MFLLFFFIYTASVCPNDKRLESPVCRGLAEYRRLVVDPYILPPIQRAFNHPSVAPVVAWMKPRAEATIEFSRPILVQTQREWKRRVVPHWNRRVLPRLRQLETFLQPYQHRVTAVYQRNAAPYLISLRRYSRKAQPYLLLTAARAYDSYTATKPYLRKVSLQLQRVPPLFYNSVVGPLVLARRQFVDRHVARMVVTIKELSRPDSSQRSSAHVSGAQFASNTLLATSEGASLYEKSTETQPSRSIFAQGKESVESVVVKAYHPSAESIPQAVKQVVEEILDTLSTAGTRTICN